MNEEDEAFEELSRRQGDWGLQGSRKHQIMRYAENVESKGTSMTDKETMKFDASAPLVMTPHPSFQKRTWVGLTDEEFEQMLVDAKFTRTDLMMIGACVDSIKEMIEAKLKEKNT